MYTNVNYLRINEQYIDQRIDNFLLNLLKGVPRTRIYRLLRKGQVRINKKRVKPYYRLQGGEILRIPPVRMAAPKIICSPDKKTASMLERLILFEDNRLIILNKPAGMAVHGGSGIRSGIIESLRCIRTGTAILELVHRLDKETSGCLMIAKKRSTLRELHAQLRDRAIKKVYLTLTNGQWRGQNRYVDAALKKNVLSSGERIVKVAKLGKQAQTHFSLRQQFAHVCLLEAAPVTGRTHQIRVHAAHIGHPIIGDGKYGDADANKAMKQSGCKRLFLHAASLQLTTANGPLCIQAPLDEELKGLLHYVQTRYKLDNA